jgi:hypothetical protein
VTVKLPAVVKEKGSDAVPLARDAVPSVVLPEMKVTSPVGFDPVTVAVKVSCWFGLALLVEMVRVVLEVTGVTATETGLEELVWLLASPA